jgi:hypothetical protein
MDHSWWPSTPTPADPRGRSAPPPSPVPPGSLPPPPRPSESEPHARNNSGWGTAVGVVGWVVTFIVIYSTSRMVLQLTLEAAGVNTVVVGSTAGDEKNPVGQVVAIWGALAVAAAGTFVLRRWYKRRSSELAESQTSSVETLGLEA